MSERARTWIALAVIGASLATIGAVLATDEPSPRDRAHALAARLKCPVCDSETIADSPTDLARDLQDLIAEQVADGWTDQEVIDFFVATYGEQVLLDPPTGGRTALLWIAPLVVAAAGVLVIIGRRAKRSTRELTEEERRAVEAAVRGAER
ncbi:MAG: cytochrome c-type biogenesis protein [Acidimicrobiia bacterium]